MAPAKAGWPWVGQRRKRTWRAGWTLLIIITVVLWLKDLGIASASKGLTELINSEKKSQVKSLWLVYSFPLKS